MTVSINDLTSAAALSGADQVPIAAAANRDTQRMSLDLLRTWMQANLTFTGRLLAKQYAAPSATGFTVAVDEADTWLILTPVAGYADGTITLPALHTDQQLIQVSCTQSVAALVVNGNGTNVIGAPTALAANGFFSLQYDSILDAWFRVG